MRVLGVDPGLRVTGYGVIEAEPAGFKLVEAGVVRTDSSAGILDRLSSIYRGIHGLMEDTKPAVLVLEKLFAHYKHPTTALLMGHARGVICLAASENKVPLVSLASTRVKKAVVSHGHANKDQVQRAVQYLLKLKTAPVASDVTDALAIALSYAMTRPRAPQANRLEAILEEGDL